MKRLVFRFAVLMTAFLLFTEVSIGGREHDKFDYYRETINSHIECLDCTRIHKGDSTFYVDRLGRTRFIILR